VSLMGIDIGSSSIKVGVYLEDGRLIAAERGDLNPVHAKPGWWEQDPEEVWLTISGLVRRLMQDQSVRRNPPEAAAISSSVRENFPADARGSPLAACIMAADIRGEEYEIPPAGAILPERWSFSCGHMRERMDPLNRLLWWRKNRPGLMEEAKYFLGWHEFLSLRMCGRVTLDGSIASRWLLFDLSSSDWDPGRLGEYGIQEEFLPEVLPWGTVIGNVRKEVLDDWGIGAPLKLAVGTADLNAAALGSGITAVGDACMVSGSFENLLVPISGLPSASMLLHGLSVTPHVGSAGRAVWAICPTGTAVLDWSRSVMGVSISDLDMRLGESEPSPSPVLAVPYLSGAFIYWQDGRNLRGALVDLTLATTRIDIIRAMMESIAYDHVNTLSLLRDEGIEVDLIRATGGGTRSSWWTQLKADVTGIAVEVADQPEPGTLGAAILAGHAVGAIEEPGVAGRRASGRVRTYEPDLERGKRHLDKIQRYKRTVAQMSAMQ
jgi:sugar (pentulose or hexulose) kinase